MWPIKILRGWCSSTDQSFAILSDDPVAKKYPEGANLDSHTAEPCAEINLLNYKVFVSHIHTDPFK